MVDDSVIVKVECAKLCIINIVIIIINADLVINTEIFS